MVQGRKWKHTKGNNGSEQSGELTSPGDQQRLLKKWYLSKDLQLEDWEEKVSRSKKHSKIFNQQIIVLKTKVPCGTGNSDREATGEGVQLTQNLYKLSLW